MIDWNKVSQLSRPNRTAKVEIAMRAVLNEEWPTSVLTTTELAALMAPDHPEHRHWIMDTLSKMAQYATGFAHHDGEEFVRFGRTMRRWRWYIKGE